MYEMPLNDDYYPDTPEEEARIEAIAELEEEIDTERRNIRSHKSDIELLKKEIKAFESLGATKEVAELKEQIEQHKEAISDCRANIDYYESELLDYDYDSYESYHAPNSEWR